VRLEGRGATLEFDLLRGLLRVEGEDGLALLTGAYAAVEVGQPGEAGNSVFRSSDPFERSARIEDVRGVLGRGRRADIRLSGLAGAPELVLRLEVWEARPGFGVSLEALNPGEADLRLARLTPLAVSAARRGGLWLGAHPRTHRILEAGSFFAFDFFVDLVPGDRPEPPETALLGLAHGYQKGHSISNGSHAVCDLEGGRGLVAGALDFEHASPMLNASFEPDRARPEQGRTPFTYWAADYPMLPGGRPLGPGERLAVGPILVQPVVGAPHAGLESLADALQAWNGIRPWHARGPEHRVPTGWNSWTGSHSSGGYGATIDEGLMLASMQVMREEFLDFGGEWFQVDDGYQEAYGDWTWRTDRFPRGRTWLADQSLARGLWPGLWVAAFQADESSRLFAERREEGWFSEGLPLLSGDKKNLDLSHPAVRDWLRELFRGIRTAGYRWVKTDFGYWALGARAFHDPRVTREEAYRGALRAIREGLDQGAREAGGQPGDTFWLNVSLTGLHTGLVDSIRPNLDTMPAWERDQADQGRLDAQGIKPTVRTLARRYHLHEKVYLFNHDMIFFRAHKDPGVAPLTREEARCLLTAICLSGGVAKLGERLLEMEPGWIQDTRRVLPVFGRAARPLDLMTREFPEVWHLRVEPEAGLNTRGVGPAYDVVALFHWGANQDLGLNPYLDLPDEPREVGVELAALGLDPDRDYLAREAWSGETRLVHGRLSRLLAPHSVELFALRPAASRPIYLGGNRHLLQGAVELRGLDWSPGARSLRVRLDAAPGSLRAGCTHELDFHLPRGWALQEARVVQGSALDLRTRVLGQADARVARVAFEVDHRHEVELALAFDGP
jgi:hypothetical protein